jgi:hypothetical protein
MSISSWDIGEEQDVIQGSVPPPLSVLMNGSVWLSDLIKEFQRQSRSEGVGMLFLHAMSRAMQITKGHGSRMSGGCKRRAGKHAHCRVIGEVLHVGRRFNTDDSRVSDVQLVPLPSTSYSDWMGKRSARTVKKHEWTRGTVL